MSMKINYNVSAMIANNSLKLNDNRLTTSLERLSSGYKINSARDDAAGLAISRRMNAQLKGLEAASQDAQDGISVVEIADGALAEVHDILQRMNELSIKAANGTLSDGDREAIQAEVAQLAEEIDRIGETTEYNSQKLFTGNFDLKGYTDYTNVKIDQYSDTLMHGNYKINISELTFDENGKVTGVDDGITTDPTNCIITATRPDGKLEEFRVSGDTYHLKLSGDDGDEIVLDIYNMQIDTTAETKATITKDADGNITSMVPAAAFQDITLEMKGYGPMTFQVGANEDQTISVRIGKLSMETLGFKNQDSDETKDMTLKMTTKEEALEGIDKIASAISQVSKMRSEMGAYQNRLEHTETNLGTSEENMTAAYSRIMDTDMAEEMSNYSNLQIIGQAATAILAQANERPSQMLQLLQ